MQTFQDMQSCQKKISSPTCGVFIFNIHFKLILSKVFRYNSKIQIEWSVFSHVASIYVNVLEQMKAFA